MTYTLARFLGGMATAGLVNPMCEFAYDGERVIGGIPYRFAQKMIEEKAAQFEYPKGNLSFSPEKYTINFTRSAMDCTYQESFSKAEQKMLGDVFTLTDILKKHVPEFKDAFISQIATVAGTRQGRRTKGLYMMTSEDYIHAVKFDDSIARACHPVDVHLPDNEGQTLTFPDSAAYIPFRCLITESYANLIMAGRAISADEDSFAAIRVQAPCMEIGQAAGTAAALCVKYGEIDVKALDIPSLLTILRDYGSFI